MIARGAGTIINITSGSGYGDPTKPAGQGGWGMGYGTSKGAFHRVAGFLAIELGDKGIRCFNVQPGLIATERIAQDMAKFGITNEGAPMEVMGKVVRWLCTDPEAEQLQRPQHRGAVLLPRARPASRLGGSARHGQQHPAGHVRCRSAAPGGAVGAVQLSQPLTGRTRA